jgi:hypothetical protein
MGLGEANIRPFSNTNLLFMLGEPSTGILVLNIEARLHDKVGIVALKAE